MSDSEPDSAMPAPYPRVIRRVVWGLILLATPLAANTLWVNSRSRPAGAHDGGTIIDTDIVPVNVKVEGDGPAILLIHGFGAAIDWWDEIAPELAKDHRVIRLDLIGHGGTAAPTSGYEITRQARLAAAVLYKLDIERVTVVGHSMGGLVATALAVLEPRRIDRLILIDSPAQGEAHFSRLTQAFLTPVLGEALSHVVGRDSLRRGLAVGFAPDFAIPERFVDDLEQLTYDAFRQAHRESLAYRTAKSTGERLSQLEPVPRLLVMFGELDQVVPAANAVLFEQVPGAKIVILEGVGHSPIVEAPEKTLAVIREFLEPPAPE